jgi:protein TonB
MYAYDSGSMVGNGEAMALPALTRPHSFATGAAASSGGYGTRSGPNWAIIGAIAALHVLALVTIVKLDVLHIVQARPEPLVLTLLAEPPAPPPASHVVPKPEKQIQPAIVTPAPIVQTVTPPSTVVATPVTPPRPVIVAPPVATPAPAPVSITHLDDSVIDGKPPKYPIESLRKKEQGTVTLRLTIGANGYVSDISVSRSSGFDRLDAAALRAVRGWRWRPMIRNGQPVEVSGYMPIPFMLAA